jgi:acetyl-CoA carboxylase biotin carboxyl carrier protein
MLTLDQMKDLIKTVDQSSVDRFKFEAEGMKVLVEKTAASGKSSERIQVEETPENQESISAAAAAQKEKIDKEASSSTDEDKHRVIAPMVGTYYSRSNPDAEPFVQVGTKVEEDQVLCVLEAMKLFNEIHSEVSGEIVEILAEEGQLIEYGQPIFVIKTVD